MGDFKPEKISEAALFVKVKNSTLGHCSYNKLRKISKFTFYAFPLLCKISTFVYLLQIDFTGNFFVFSFFYRSKFNATC